MFRRFLLLTGWLLAIAVQGTAADPVLYAPMERDEVRLRLLAWAAEQPERDAARAGQVKQLWDGLDPTAPADRVLEALVTSFAIYDVPTARLLDDCRLPAQSLGAPPVDAIRRPGLGDFYLHNMRLYTGRYYVDRMMYDEAWELLESIDPHQLVDPASLWFYRAVAGLQLLQVKEASAAVDQLLKNTAGVPVRYSQTARLMQAELAGLQENPLGETARLMSDSERRLDLGRSGEKVQEVQEKIVANLDELIKKIEQQGGGGGGGGSSSGGDNQGQANPADDSRVKGSTAPGLTDPKSLSKQGKWGDLPEKEQAKAQNLINRNFPSHYRQAIESYFKKLSNRPAQPARD